MDAPTNTPLVNAEHQLSPSSSPLPIATATWVPRATLGPIPTATPTPEISRTPKPTPTAASGIVRIETGEFFQNPPIVTIYTGTIVEWVPIGELYHTITSQEGNPNWPKDGSVGPPGNPPFRVTFQEPGVYEYYCSIHPGAMDGVIVVVEAGAEGTN